MKKINLIIALVCCVSTIGAQDNETGNKPGEIKTIFGGKKIGGYGGIGVGYTTIDNRSGLTLNARAGVILGHWLSIGLGGAGFINDPENDNLLNSDVCLTGGYGGLYIEPIAFPKSSVHISFPILVGIGGVTYYALSSDDNGETDGYVENSQVYFVVEPAAELEFNFSKWFRTAVFVSYRYTSNLDWQESPADALCNFSTGLIFKFGKF